MKLKLNLSLRRALYAAVIAVAAHASSIVTTLATSGMAAAAVSFSIIAPQADAAIYTWNGSVDDELYKLPNWDGLTDTWQSTWSASAANMMRFTGVDSATKIVTPHFDTLSLSGTIIDAGAIGYTVCGDSATRDVNLRATIDADYAALTAKDYKDGQVAKGKINFIVNEDFNFGRDGMHWDDTTLHADMNVYIASGKVFNFYTQDILATSACNIDIHGGGTMNLTATTISNFVSWTVRGVDEAGRTTLNVKSAAGLGSTTMGGYATINLNGGQLTGVLNVSGQGNQLNSTVDLTLANDINLAADSSLALTGASVITGAINVQGAHTSISSATALNLTGVISFESLIAAGTTNGADYALTLGANVSINTAATINLSGISTGTYTLFTTEGANIADYFDWTSTTIIGIGGRMTSEWAVSTDGKSINLVITGAAADLVWADGDGVWSTDKTAGKDWHSTSDITDYDFIDGDKVTFSGTGGATITSTIDIQGSVSPSSLLIQGDQNWVFSGAGSIDGLSKLVMNGSGSLTINTENNYTLGSDLKSGSVIITTDTALGTGAINFNGGKLVIGGVNLTIANTVNGNADIELLAGNKATMTSAVSNLTLSGDGSLQLNEYGEVNGNYSVASGATLVMAGTVGSRELKHVVSGDGDISYTGTAETVINSTGFTGTVTAAAGSSGLIVYGNADVSARYSLQLNADIFIARHNVGNTYSLKLANLSGDGNITNSTLTEGYKHTDIDLAMTQDNTWNGELIYNSNLAAVGIIVDSAQNEGAEGVERYTFTMSHKQSFNAANDGYSGMHIKNATVKFIGEANWNSSITFEQENSRLILAGNDLTLGLAGGSIDQFISTTVGHGVVEINTANTITIDRDNTTFSGAFEITQGTLKIQQAAALGTASVWIKDAGHLSMAAGATTLTAINVSVSAGAEMSFGLNQAAGASSLTLNTLAANGIMGGTTNPISINLTVEGALTSGGSFTLIETIAGFTGLTVEDFFINLVDLDGNNVILDAGAELILEGNKLILNVPNKGDNLVWAGTGGVWSTDATVGTDWVDSKDFVDGDNVTFNGEGGTTITSTIEIQGVVKPSKIVIDGNQNWVFSGAGSIDGSSKLVMNGSGSLTINTENNYTLGSELTSGSVIITKGTALGTGAINFGGGKLVINGADLTIENTVTGNAVIELFAGSNVTTMASAVSNLTLSGVGSLQLNQYGDVSGNYSVADGATLVMAGAVGSTALKHVVSGNGDITYTGTADTVINPTGFTGTVTAATGSTGLIVLGNTAEDTRYSLVLNADISITQASGYVGAKSIKFANLSGTGNITNSSMTGDWHHTDLDLAMTHDNTWDGKIILNLTNSAVGMIVDSAQNEGVDGVEHYTFTMSKAQDFDPSNAGYSGMHIKNATVKLIDDARWNSSYTFENENSRLILAGNDLTFGGAFTGEKKSINEFISTTVGHGVVEINTPNTITIDRANNAFSGAFEITQGTLKIQQAAGLGTASVWIKDAGHLSMAAGATTLTAINVSVSAGAEMSFGLNQAAGESSLTLKSLTANGDMGGAANPITINLTITDVLASGDYFTLIESTDGFTGLTADDFLIKFFDASGKLVTYDTVLKFEGNKLVLSVPGLEANLVWGGGPGAWNAENAWAEGGADATFAGHKSNYVTFNGGTGEITLDPASETNVVDMTVTGTGTNYSFINGSLQINGALSIAEGADATFDSTVVSFGDRATLSVGAGSELIIKAAEGNALNLSNTLTNAGSIVIGTNTSDVNLTVGAAFDNAGGTLTVNGNLTLGTATALGGNVTANSLNLAVGTDNDFVSLKVEGLVTSTGLLTLSADSTIGSLSGGSLSVSAGNVTVGNVISSLDSLSNSGVLSVDSNLTVTGAFDNADSTLTVVGELSLGTATTQGGNVTANSLNLAAGTDNDFASLKVEGVVDSSGMLTLGGDSTIGSLSGGSLSVSAGNVTVGDVIKSLDSLSNSGVLSIGSNLTVTGAFDNADSTLTVDGELSLGTATIQGGNVTARSLKLAADTDNVFTSLHVQGTVTSTGSISLSADSNMGSYAGGGSVDIGTGATLSVATTATTSFDHISGGGALSVEGSLELTGTTASSINSLNIGGDTLTTAAALSVATGNLSVTKLNLGGKLNTTGSLDVSNIKVNYSLTAGTPLLDVGSLTANTINIDLGDSLASFVPPADGGLSLFIELDEAFKGNLTLNGGESVIVSVYEYTLVKGVDNNYYLQATIAGNTWQGEGNWSSETGDWSMGTSPEESGAYFTADSGVKAVVLDGDQVASYVAIQTTEGNDYSFSGDSLTTGKLTVLEGKLIVQNNIDVTGDTTVIADANGKIIIASNAILDIATSGNISATSVELAANASLINSGNMVVSGAITATDATITNNGSLSVGDGSKLGVVTGDGNLIISAGAVSLDTLSGGSLEIATGAELTLNQDNSLGAFVNNGSIDAGVNSLTLTEQVALGGDITAAHIIIDAGATGSSFGNLVTDSLTLNGELSAGDYMISVDSITAGLADKVTLNLGNFDKVELDATYNIIDAGPSGSWADFDLAPTATAVRESGKDLIFRENDGKLSVEITEAIDRTWTTSDNFAATPNTDESNYITPILDDEGKLASYDVLDSVHKVVVNEDVILDLTGVDQGERENGVNIENLSGNEGVTLSIKGDGIGKDFVDLNNSGVSVAGNSLNVTGVSVNYSNSAEQGVHAELYLKELSMTSSAFIVEDGAIINIESAALDASQLSVNIGGSIIIGDLSLSNGSSISVGNVESAPLMSILSDTEVKKAELTLGRLTISDSDSSVTVGANGILNVYDKLILEKEAALTIQAGGSAELANVELKDSSQLIAETGGEIIVGSLSGSSTSMISGDVTVKGSGGNYEGEFATASSMTVGAGAQQTVTVSSNLSVIGEVGSSIKLNHDKETNRDDLNSITATGSLIYVGSIDGVNADGGNVAEAIKLNEASSLSDGSILKFRLDADDLIERVKAGGDALDVFNFGADGSLTMTDSTICIGADVGIFGGPSVIDISGMSLSESIVLADLELAEGSHGNSVIFEGLLFKKYFTNGRVEGGHIVADINNNAYGALSSSSNGAAGTSLLSNALLEINPQYRDRQDDALMDDTTGHLTDAMDSMDYYIQTGASAASDKLAAAVAGASVTALGTAQMSDMERQLGSIRNRTMSMGLNPYETNEEQPTGKAWISAEGGSSKLDNEGTSAGHDLSTFGGSVGVDFDVHENFSFGAAITAMYGSIDSNAADVGDGTLNTQYVTFFARSNVKRWTHSFIASFGSSDADMDRTVNYFGGKYETKGSTDGFSAGLMYELGYTIPLDEEMNTCWQPVFNISFVKSSLDGYTERGSDAGLKVGDQDSSYVTLGLGGRIETVVGTSAYNRASILSARAMFKADMGDRSSEADVSFANAAGSSVTVKGAEAGAVGAEFGIGLTIPVTFDTGAIFMDASVDLRDGMTSGSGSVGYRFAF